MRTSERQRLYAHILSLPPPHQIFRLATAAPAPQLWAKSTLQTIPNPRGRMQKKNKQPHHSHICCLYINAHEVQTQLMQLMHNVFSLPSGTYIELICFTHLSWLYCDVTWCTFQKHLWGKIVTAIWSEDFVVHNVQHDVVDNDEVGPYDDDNNYEDWRRSNLGLICFWPR